MEPQRNIEFTDDFSSELLENVPESEQLIAQKIRVIRNATSTTSERISPETTFAPINDHAPVYIQHRVQKQNKSSIQSYINCAYCNRTLSYKGSKRYLELTSELAAEQFNHEMIQLNKRAAHSYADLANQIAKQQAIINDHYERNMLFPEQNKLVYVEISGCTLHTLK